MKFWNLIKLLAKTKDGKTNPYVIIFAIVLIVIVSFFGLPILIIIIFGGNFGGDNEAPSISSMYSLDNIAFKSMATSGVCRTPEGVVMAAEWLYNIGGAHTDHPVEYDWGGKSVAIGWDPKWDKMTTDIGKNGEKYYQRYGLDCSGFVRWAFINAGFEEAKSGYTINAAGTVAHWGIERLDAEGNLDVTAIRPGDYAYRHTSAGDHIGIVTEVTDTGIYVIHEAGHGSDLIKSFYDFEKTKEASKKKGWTREFKQYFDSKLYYIGNNECTWQVPTINDSNIIVKVKGQQITLEEYVMGVVAHEMDYGKPMPAEALKAQAIAARSYMLSYAVKGARRNDVKMTVETDDNGKRKYIIEIFDTTANFQRYDPPETTLSVSEMTRVANEVIIPTAGMVIVHDNKVVTTSYSTRDAKANEGNYKDPHYKVPTNEEIASLFTDANIQKAIKMRDNGELGPYDNFWTSRAHGHDHGLEQAGAVLMAVIEKWTAEQMLNYYYAGEIKSINEWLDANIDTVLENIK